MTPNTSVTARAEAATLGAILLQPQAIERLLWLRSGDFADPWHARVHNLLRQHEPAEVNPQALGEWLISAYPPQVADLPRVASLLEATPLRPDPAAYARMVLAASIRRDQPGYGVLLRGGALQAALTGTAHPMCAAAAFTDRGINATEDRWEQAHLTPGAPHRPRLSQPVEVGVRDVLRGADRYLNAHGDPNPETVRDHEQDLIATLITHPHAVGAVTAWLDPDMVTDRVWRASYHAIADLAAAGEPIDEVTVAWRTHQLTRINGPGPDPRDLHTVVDAVLAHDPAWTSRLVASDQLRALADRASACLVANAANPGLSIPDLLDSARAHTAALTDLAQNALPEHTTPDFAEQVLPLITRAPGVPVAQGARWGQSATQSVDLGNRAVS